jgi:hypothetical protein
MDAITVTDTLINEPRIEARGTAWALRLPTDMARILSDSLPGLMPHELVLGDFNGDSKVDVAIDGNTGNASSFFILLSKSDSVPQPRLLFVWKANARVPDLYTYMDVVHPKEFPGDGGMTGPFSLRTDAVVYGYEMAATIYFVDKGAISSYSIAD